MRTKALEKTLSMIGLSLDDGHDEYLDGDIKRVMACTNSLVEYALQADWLAVLEGMETRRRMLQALLESQSEVLSPRLNALNEAVSESERALMRVVAHAIASSRNSRSPFAMYH